MKVFYTCDCCKRCSLHCVCDDGCMEAFYNATIMQCEECIKNEINNYYIKSIQEDKNVVFENHSMFICAGNMNSERINMNNWYSSIMAKLNSMQAEFGSCHK